MHFKGFTHNDIKPQNILIGENQTVTLVDFGAADSISDRIQTVKKFSGNPMFASLYQLKFIKTSMRDDLISIYQMMLSLINDDATQFLNVKNLFEYCVRFREENDLMDLALTAKYQKAHESINYLDPSHKFYDYLLQIAKIIQGLEYNQVPQYNRIRMILHQAK